MHEREEGLSDKEVSLLLEMVRENGVEVDKVEVRVQESPVCDTQQGGI